MSYYMESESDDLIRAVIELFVEKIVIGEEGVEIVYYLQPFSYLRRSLWTTYQSRENLASYKGLLPSLLKRKMVKACNTEFEQYKTYSIQSNFIGLKSCM